MSNRLGDSSDDEFPEVDVLVRQYRHQVQAKPEGSHNGGKGESQATVKSVSQRERDAQSKPNATAKATPLRRRKLGQGQIVDGSLLKPWGDTVASKEKNDRAPKPTNSRPSIREASARARISPKEASRPLSTTVRQTGPRITRTSTEPSISSKEKQKPQQKDWGKGGEIKDGQLSSEVSSLQKEEVLESSEEDNEDNEDDEDEEEEISEFVSLSDSETDAWNSGSEAAPTPPTRRPKSPTSHWAKPQRVLFDKPSRKAEPRDKEVPQAIITDPTKRAPRQFQPGGSVLDSIKASRPGNLEDTFQKLLIFNEDSEPDDPPAKGVGNPILEPTTPKKTLPASPHKTPRIPKSPWKPEHKEFWDPEVNFAWIDEHSPEKPEGAEKKKRTMEKPVAGKDQAAEASKTHSKLLYSTSPEKRDARKAFDAVKQEMAREFLRELDDRITGGRLTQMTRDTGGLRITWSKSLLTTAGRAHWKCRTLSPTTRHPDGSVTTAENLSIRQHHASIELASKVLGNESDLLNTVAHEFCHLAVFMLGGPDNNSDDAGMGMGVKAKRRTAAHGPEFKAWGARCGVAFADRGICVTTRHNYEIEYKYIWSCDGCGMEVKRHSKSVDTTRQRCGKCRGALLQVKPKPRASKRAPANNTFGAPPLPSSELEIAVAAKKSAWAEFVSKETRALARTNPGMALKDRMPIISSKWRQLEKEEKLKLKPNAEPQDTRVKELQSRVQVLVIEDDDNDGDGDDYYYSDNDKEDEEKQGRSREAHGTYNIFS